MINLGLTSDIGLTSENALEIAQILNRTLGNEMTLYVKTKNFHWNVTGPNFSEYHKLFDEQADTIIGFVDEVAERVRVLDIPAAGAMTQYLELKTLAEEKGSLSAAEMLSSLLKDHEQLIRELRVDLATCSELGDEGNADFLTGLMESHEKIAWMLRASSR